MFTAADLGGCLVENLRRNGDRLALVVGGTEYTGAQCERAVMGFARGLGSLNLPTDARVAVMLTNVAEFPFANLGTWVAGYTYMPVNALYSGDELLRLLNAARPAVLVCHPATAAELREAPGGVPEYLTRIVVVGKNGDFNEFVETSALQQADPAGAVSQEWATLAFTSGTTAAPKGVRVAAGQIALAEEVVVERFDLSEREVILQSLPYFHSNVSLAGVMLAWWIGGTAVLLPRFAPVAFVEAVRTHSATFALGTATVMFDLIEQIGVEALTLPTLRTYGFGGMRLNPEVRERFESATGVRAVQCYGMTEGPHTIATEHEADERSGTYVGRALPHVRVFTVNEDGVELAPGTLGELAIGSAVEGKYARRYVPFEHYLGDDEREARGHFATGDLGSVDASGRIHFVDRMRDVLSCGGYKVSPSEIEETLLADPRIAEAYVVGAKDARRGDVPVAFVVAEAGQSVSVQDVIDLSAVLAPYKRLVGAEIVETDQLPRNALGKVVKKDLKAEAVPLA